MFGRFQKDREGTNDRQKLLEISVREKKHLALIRAERVAYSLRMQEAKGDTKSVLSVALDGADQGAYGLPYFSQPTKSSQTIFKIRQYVVGVVIHGVGIHLYRHIDLFKRGANVTIEVLHRMLEVLHRTNGGNSVFSFYYQKNVYVTHLLYQDHYPGKCTFRWTIAGVRTKTNIFLVI